MLKIKDNVDLKKLEKYGLKKINNYDSNDIGNITLDGADFMGWVDIRGFEIYEENLDFYSSCFEIETLYDLIKADLVEKVED